MKKGILKNHALSLGLLMRALDLLVVIGAAIVAYHVRFEATTLPSTYRHAIVIALFVTGCVFDRFDLYRAWRVSSVVAELKVLTTAWLLTFLTLALIAVMTQTAQEFSREWMLCWLLFGLMGLIVYHALLRAVLRLVRATDHNTRSVVFVVGGELGERVLRQLQDAPWTGLRVAGYFDDRSAERRANLDGVPHLGRFADIAEFVERDAIDQVWIVMPLLAEGRVRDVLHVLRYSTADICFVPDIFSFQLLNQSVETVAGTPVITLSATPMTGFNRIVKGIEDCILAALILALISPLMVVIAIGVRLSSPGPVLYRQERVSWNNRPFMMLKFRSMPVDAEAGTGAVWARKGEQRATGFGAFLRKTSLDELPQFINVLRGEMSIVGPRPERPVFVDKFKNEIPRYMKKHMVKAGITGWAQVNGLRGDTDLGKRIEYDLYYIEHWSLWFDFKIIGSTLFKGFVNSNAY